MSQAEALKLLEDELAKQIAGFDDSRQYYRRKYFHFTIVSSVLSALTTILIGAGQIFESKLISALALIISASITVATALDSFLRSRELWVQKTDTWMILQNLDSNIKYAKAKADGNLSDEQVDEFYRRFDTTLMGEHELWKKIRSTQGNITK